MLLKFDTKTFVVVNTTETSISDTDNNNNYL